METETIMYAVVSDSGNYLAKCDIDGHIYPTHSLQEAYLYTNKKSAIKDMEKFSTWGDVRVAHISLKTQDT